METQVDKTSNQASETLTFENPHFLQSLFANDLGLLKQLEEYFSVKVITRDGWLKIEGDVGKVLKAKSVFEALESVRRKGGEIGAHTFRLAMEQAQGSDGEERDGKAGLVRAGSLDELADLRLLGSATKAPVMPRTGGQLKYLKALQQYEVVFGLGPAGTGKTFLAMAHALQQLKDRKIDRIIMTRPAVEAGEALGFLPGDLQEKVFPYLRPLYDALYEMLEADEAQKLIDKNLIEVAPLAYMRGRTLNRAYVILDEGQNATKEQMLMFLTRLGEESKCVVTGDPSQIDLRPRNQSGLLEAMELLRETEGITFAQFDRSDVVRHPVVERIIAAYEKRGEGEPRMDANKRE
ncbi:MAG: AAA family ATPase [Verrucomicrobia bacterium]|nr:AAA family ATPase [Verrucomicrobiota bacterium]